MIQASFEDYNNTYRTAPCECGHTGEQHAWNVGTGTAAGTYIGDYCKRSHRDSNCYQYNPDPEQWQQTLPGTSVLTSRHHIPEYPRKGIKLFTPSAVNP